MNAKALYNALLLSSTLVLTACGGGNGSSSDSESHTQEDLSKVNSELKSIQDQANEVLIKLTQANQEAGAKKLALDALQTKFANGEVGETEVAAAQAAYEKSSSEIANLEQKKAELADQVRKLKEKADTITAAAKLDSSLNNMGSAVLSGTFSREDLATLMNAVNTKTAEQLVAPVNKFIVDTKTSLNSGAKIRAAFPKVINAPIIDSFVIPLMSQLLGGEIQAAGEKEIRTYPILANSANGGNMLLLKPGISMDVPYKKTATPNEYILSFPLKEAIKNSTWGLKYQLEAEQYNGILNFIDDYFRDNRTKFSETVNLNLTVGDPTVLQSDIQQLLVKLKPIAEDVVRTMPEEWMTYFAEMIQHIPEVGVEDMAYLKGSMTAFAAQGLSAEAPVSTLGNTAYRKSRSDVGGVGLTQFVVDGQALDQSYAIDMPLRVDLKGSITSGKTSDVVGSVTYNINGTVLGVIQSYNNTVDLHAETSLLVSQSMGNFFIEGQAGFVGVREGQFSGWEGQRYQATLGYDAAHVSPFIQLEYRPLTNGFSTLDATGVYVGLESDVLKVQMHEGTLTSTVLAKVGYESASETLFTGHSLRSNQGTSAFVEWTGGLKLSNGFEVESALTLGSNDQTAKLNIAFEQ